MDPLLGQRSRELTLSDRSGWAVTLGVLLVVLGAFAIGGATIATLASVALFGWVLVGAGVVHVVHAMRLSRWRGHFSHLFLGLLELAVGVLMLARPAEGAASLTMLLAALFLATGLMRVVGAAALRYPSWGWSILAGLVSIGLCLAVLAGWPSTSIWVLGALVGVEVLAGGMALLAVGVALREGRPPPRRRDAPTKAPDDQRPVLQ